MTPHDLHTLQTDAEAGDVGAQFALAQALERMKRGPEARPWLERAAGAGHPLAQTLLGARILLGETTAETWRKGVDLIAAGHRAGVADATAMLAGLFAMGADTRARWSEALDLVQVAAERGSTRGRAQLRALGLEHGSTADAEDWAGLRAAVSLDRWSVAPPPEVLCDAPRIVAFRNFVSPAVCAWMIERARGRTKRALVYDAATGLGRVEQERSNSGFPLNVIEFDLMIALARARIAAATGAAPERMEAPQILNYQVGETFAPHFDFLDESLPGLAMDVARRGQRAMTFLIYLNDAFEGGETAFPDLGLSVRGRPGDAILFHNLDPAGRPDRRTRHAGLPPTRGEKWLFSQWIRDRAPG